MRALSSTCRLSPIKSNNLIELGIHISGLVAVFIQSFVLLCITNSSLDLGLTSVDLRSIICASHVPLDRDVPESVSVIQIDSLRRR